MAMNKMDNFLPASDDSHQSEVNSSSDLSCEWRDWTGLPAHLLFDIADKFTDLDDYVSFGRVCTSWQTTFVHNIKSLGSPLLLIDPPDENDYNQRALYSVSNKSVCDFMVPLPHSKKCRGSSFGWLITLEEKDDDDYHIQLQNPFLSRTINLPPLDNIVQLHPDEYSSTLSYDGSYLWKAVISSNPCTSDDFIIMASVSRYRGLAYLKAGNQCWTPIGDHWALEQNKMFEDVIFYHQAKQFYALRHCGTLLAITFHGDDQEPELTQVAPPLGIVSYSKYLVEDLVSGDLLQVCRIDEDTEKDQNGKRHCQPRYLIFKLNPLEQSWGQIHDLGGKVLLAETTCSVLRSASDCPGSVPNCVYFIRRPVELDPNEYYRDVTQGMFNLEDGTVQDLSFTNRNLIHPPIWLEPTLPLSNMEQRKNV